jgi:hypothetical protein
MNFRVDLPPDHPHAHTARHGDFAEVLESYSAREEIKEHDQLLKERRKGTVFVGLREGRFWDFKCSYKYHIGEVDRYKYEAILFAEADDRILMTLYNLALHEHPHGRTALCMQHTQTLRIDQKTRKSPIFCIPLSLRILRLTMCVFSLSPTLCPLKYLPTICHIVQKPVVALLLLPPSSPSSTSAPVLAPPVPPIIQLPTSYTPVPFPYATLVRYTGRALDRTLGSILFLLTLIGAGSAVFGIANFFAALGGWIWWRTTALATSPSV